MVNPPSRGDAADWPGVENAKTPGLGRRFGDVDGTPKNTRGAARLGGVVFPGDPNFTLRRGFAKILCLNVFLGGLEPLCG
ncbi:MAG: hypothetical protein Ct9H300mP8_08770 [Gammaproteobacteria bacterium]|nr:MAG: hypothetical protein Ct9H300mP8_08770 [Gammaproteobacteria bacterium]